MASMRPTGYARATMARTSLRQCAVACALIVGTLAAAWLWRTWQAGEGDPSLTGDPRDYVRASGPLITPHGIAIAAAFSDGPGRISIADAVALRGRPLSEAVARLGAADALLGDSATGATACWWNVVISDLPGDLQPPALHLRLDITASNVQRVACLGAKLVDVTARTE